MKVQWFKVHSKARSRLNYQYNRWAEQNRIWSDSPCNQSGKTS